LDLGTSKKRLDPDIAHAMRNHTAEDMDDQLKLEITGALKYSVFICCAVHVCGYFQMTKEKRK